MSFADREYTDGIDTRTVREWCKILNVSYHTVRSRHARGAGDSFHKLFKVKPVQLRRTDALLAKHAEATFQTVDLLEIIFGRELKEKILTHAKHKATLQQGAVYSVNETLYELVKNGLIYLERHLTTYEKDLEEDAAQRRQRHPDGVPAQVVINDGNYMYTPSPAAFGVQPAPQITLPPPMTLEEAADIGDW